jgi:hypothetical protein
MLRQLANVPVDEGQSVSALASTSAGRLFLTLTGGPHCDEPKREVYMECPRWFPNSCSNEVRTASPGQLTFRELFSIPGESSIQQAVPNPAGTRVIFAISPCLGVHGTSALVIRNLKTEVTRTLVSSPNPCYSYGPVAWNPAGTELVFPYSPAGGKPTDLFGERACPSGPDYLALTRAAPNARLRLIKPPRGCVFGTAAFDHRGIVATVGCDNHEPATECCNNHIGWAYLLQYNRAGRLKKRTPLELGLEQSVIEAVPGTGDLLVTQDQPANQGYPERDWV